MVMTKRTKASRHRGSSSHSWGHKKKHRGAGHRGGKGLAGTGARGDSQKPGILKGSKKILKKLGAGSGRKISQIVTGKRYFGKYGFHSIHKKNREVLSLHHIENNFDALVEAGVIEKKGSEFVLDTSEDYDKVLGRGAFSHKITLICNEISASAKASIEKAGGKVDVLKASEDDFEEAESESKEE
jgi:large subunit ribosomal protein L15